MNEWYSRSKLAILTGAGPLRIFRTDLQKQFCKELVNDRNGID